MRSIKHRPVPHRSLECEGASHRWQEDDAPNMSRPRPSRTPRARRKRTDECLEENRERPHTCSRTADQGSDVAEGRCGTPDISDRVPCNDNQLMQSPPQGTKAKSAPAPKRTKAAPAKADRPGNPIRCGPDARGNIRLAKN